MALRSSIWGGRPAGRASQCFAGERPNLEERSRRDMSFVIHISVLSAVKKIPSIETGGIFLTKEQKNLQSGNMVSYPQRTEYQVLFLSRYTIWSSFYGLTQLFTEEAREVFMFR